MRKIKTNIYSVEIPEHIAKQKKWWIVCISEGVLRAYLHHDLRLGMFAYASIEQNYCGLFKTREEARTHLHAWYNKITKVEVF